MDDPVKGALMPECKGEYKAVIDRNIDDTLDSSYAWKVKGDVSMQNMKLYLLVFLSYMQKSFLVRDKELCKLFVRLKVHRKEALVSVNNVIISTSVLSFLKAWTACDKCVYKCFSE